MLRLCRKAGLVKPGHVSLDGTKVKANASWHKAMIYTRMKEEEKRLRKEIRELLKRAEAMDAAEDEQYGAGRRDDELPKELSRRKDRLKTIREARKDLEEEAKAAVEEERKRREQEDRRRGNGPHSGRPRSDVKDVPEDKKQCNFSDPETSIMKSNNKGFDKCGNAQAAVDRKHQIVVAADVTSEANDKKQLKPMVEQARENIGRQGRIGKFSADSGYFSEYNVRWLAGQRIDGYIATGRLKHNEQMAPHPQSPPARHDGEGAHGSQTSYEERP